MSRSSVRRTSLGGLAAICLPDLLAMGDTPSMPQNGLMVCAVDHVTEEFESRRQLSLTRYKHFSGGLAGLGAFAFHVGFRDGRGEVTVFSLLDIVRYPTMVMTFGCSRSFLIDCQ